MPLSEGRLLGTDHAMAIADLALVTTEAASVRI